MRSILLFASVFIVGSLFAQKTANNTAKMDYLRYPTLPVSGMQKVGVQIYTGSLPFTKDTLRLYLGNMDILKSGGERMAKVDHKALGKVDLVGGKGDITFTMADPSKRLEGVGVLHFKGVHVYR